MNFYVSGKNEKTTAKGSYWEVHGTLRDKDEFYKQSFYLFNGDMDLDSIYTIESEKRQYPREVITSYQLTEDEPLKLKASISLTYKEFCTDFSNAIGVTPKVLDTLLTELTNKNIRTAPASIGHHGSMKKGLMLHLHSLLQAGLLVCDYHEVDKRMFAIAVLFHDIGKAISLKVTDSGSVEKDDDLEAKFGGHIGIGMFVFASKLERIVELLGDFDTADIYHVIMSHHFHSEWGSMREPKTPLAMLIHTLDFYDGRMGK